MIEKLEIKNGGVEDLLNCIKKTNELVDAVNELQKQIDKVSCAILDLATPNGENKALKSIKAESKTHADPYEEQRKWIGKLCHFWNKTEYTDDIYGFLTDIVSTNKYKPEDSYFVPFKDEFGSFYEHCEPVKPDDDIIYKGE